MIILNLLIYLDISLDTEYIWVRILLHYYFFLVGVPTHIKMMSDFFIESFKSVENFNFFILIIFNN